MVRGGDGWWEETKESGGTRNGSLRTGILGGKGNRPEKKPRGEYAEVQEGFRSGGSAKLTEGPAGARQCSEIHQRKKVRKVAAF